MTYQKPNFFWGGKKTNTQRKIISILISQIFTKEEAKQILEHFPLATLNSPPEEIIKLTRYQILTPPKKHGEFTVEIKGEKLKFDLFWQDQETIILQQANP